MTEKTEGMDTDTKVQKQEGGLQEEEEKRPGASAFEGIYDRMPDISIRALDRFILACVIALVAVVAVGILRANHVF